MHSESLSRKRYYETESRRAHQTHRQRPVKRAAKESLDEQLEGFTKNMSKMAGFISDSVERSIQMQVFPDALPGALRKKLKDRAPEEPENLDDILNDYAEHILPMTLHWKHPYFFAYFPGGNGFANIIGDMLSTTLGGVGFSWTAQPSLTELERVMMDWTCHALDLPDFFSFEMSNGKGGGVIQNTASDAIFSSIIAARHDQLLNNGAYLTDSHGNIIINPKKHPGEVLTKLVAYVNQEAHSCVIKGSRIALCTIRVLIPNLNDEINGKILETEIKKDVKLGLIPFYCCASLGTTGGCSFDVLYTIGPVCRKYGLWLHIDSAYGGNAFICPEFRFLKKGIAFAHSLEVNPYKFLMGSIDCSCMFLKDVKRYKRAWQINATYLYDEFANEKDPKIKLNEIDYRHYGLPLSRRMRSLKLYCLFRHYGIKGLQRYVRNAVKCAKHFESLVRNDQRFEISNDVWLALVCFRQKPQEGLKRGGHAGPLSHTDKQNLNLLVRINKTRFIHLVPGTLQSNYVLRYSVNYEHSTIEMMNKAWNIIQSQFVTSLDPGFDSKRARSAKEIRETYRMGHVKAVSREAYDRYVARRGSTIPMTFGEIIVPIDDDLKNFFQLKRKRPITLQSHSKQNRESALVPVDRSLKNSQPNSRPSSRHRERPIEDKFYKNRKTDSRSGERSMVPVYRSSKNLRSNSRPRSGHQKRLIEEKFYKNSKDAYIASRSGARSMAPVDRSSKNLRSNSRPSLRHQKPQIGDKFYKNSKDAYIASRSGARSMVPVDRSSKNLRSNSRPSSGHQKRLIEKEFYKKSKDAYIASRSGPRSMVPVDRSSKYLRSNSRPTSKDPKSPIEDISNKNSKDDNIASRSRSQSKAPVDRSSKNSRPSSKDQKSPIEEKSYNDSKDDYIASRSRSQPNAPVDRSSKNSRSNSKPSSKDQKPPIEEKSYKNSKDDYIASRSRSQSKAPVDRSSKNSRSKSRPSSKDQKPPIEEKSYKNSKVDYIASRSRSQSKTPVDRSSKNSRSNSRPSSRHQKPPIEDKSNKNNKDDYIISRSRSRSKTPPTHQQKST